MTDSPALDTVRPLPADLHAWVEEASRGTLIERMAIEIVHVDPAEASARMPVAGNTQPYGLLHGGASVVLAESLGSFLAAIHAGPERAAVGIEINATHHRAATSGWVTATARFLHAGNTTCSFEIVVTDEAGARICTCRLTCLLRDRPPAENRGA